jgi:hypothetical protein
MVRNARRASEKGLNLLIVGAGSGHRLGRAGPPGS